MFPLDQKIPKRLPLLDAYLSRFAGKAKPFSRVTAVLIQHQLGSLVPMTRALHDLGLDPARTYLIDIPYTANAKVRAGLRALGIPRENFAPSSYDLSQPYATYQRRRVQQLFTQLQERLQPRDQLLVLDDGSYFLEAIACYTRPRNKIAVVEQTTRGTIKIAQDASLRDYCTRLPIINVAESSPKKKLESPHIGKAVCSKLTDHLKTTAKLRATDKALVLGYGAIGQEVVKALRKCTPLLQGNIFIADPKRQNAKLATRHGYRLWNRDAPARVRFKLVVGCSGNVSFTIGDRIFLEHGATLASASSGSAELSREQFIDLADTDSSDDIFVKDRHTLHRRSIHSNIDMHLVGRDVTFLNGGFPVNFDGEINCVPPRFIQATHTLQVGAAVQAVTTQAKGLLPLDRELCSWVTRNFRPIARAAGL